MDESIEYFIVGGGLSPEHNPPELEAWLEANFGKSADSKKSVDVSQPIQEIWSAINELER